MKIFIAISLLMLVILCVPLQADTPEEIVVVFFDGGYPPFYMAGLEEGMIIDFLKAFDAATPELTLVFQALSRKRIDLAMTDGSAQMSGLTNPMFVDPNVVDRFLFSKPIWTSGNYIMMNKNNAFSYTSPEDLFEKRLGVIYGNRNGILDPYIEAKQIKALPVNENSLLYKALERGRVDVIVANKHVVPYEMKLEGIDPAGFVFADPPVFEFELMTQVQKTHQHIVDALNKFIEESQANGLIDRITKKYIE